jgi:signal transduction histidine kinase
MLLFRRRMGLAEKLGLLLVVLITPALGIYGYLAHQSRQRVLMNEASAELRNHATLVEAAVVGAVERGELLVLKQRLERLARADRILGIAAFEASGEAILVTDHLTEATEELAELARRASATATDLEEPRDLGNGPALVRTVIFAPRQGPPIVAIVARDLSYVEVLGRNLNQSLALTGVLLLLATGGLVFVLSRATVGRPAAAIVRGAEAIASGQLETTVPEEGAEELARLARAFNAMTHALREARARTSEEEARRLAEQAGRLGAERKLQHARALAAVGRVAASIGHEIGSPLGVILGRARLLAQQPGCNEAVRRDLTTIAEQSERISRVVARLLSVARPPKAGAKCSQVGVVIADVLLFLGPECRQRHIVTRVEGAVGQASVSLEPDHLFQVLFNLCLNAIEAQPDGGELTVAVKQARAEGHRPRIAIEVTDAGPGIPEDVEPRIFEPFFTTKSDRGGSGLGLDIVSGLIGDAGGAVGLVRGASAGACFRVTLPACEPPVSAVRSVA